MKILRLRIKNCIKTILETQTSVPKRHRSAFAEDFRNLNAYLGSIDKMDPEEADVLRLEALTAEFIREAATTSRAIAPAGRLQ